ncbi:MAG: aldehyde dehydrogenase family protein, partial [Balneolales bacterium]|nr:aldehyde dehydrogenase family protein [Balneolales bacterium]
MQSTIDKAKDTNNFVNGKFVATNSPRMDVISPIDGSVISTVPMSTYNDLDQAVQSARAAFPDWSGRTLKDRVQVLYKYRELLEKHKDELTEICMIENGKTWGESKAEGDKSIELTEFACSMPQIISNEVQEGSRGVEVRIDRKPLGVVASIAPFNFPNMVP